MTAMLSVNSPEHSVELTANGSLSEPTRTGPSRQWFAARRSQHKLPREGPCLGGGLVMVLDRGLYEGRVREACTPEDEPLPAGLERSGRRRHSGHSGRMGMKNSGSKAGTSSADITTETPRSASNHRLSDEQHSSTQPAGPKERRRQEMRSKWEKTEAVRSRDHSNMVEHIEHSKDWRESRYKRLVSSLRGIDAVAFETSMDLRDREARQHQRTRQLHDEWQQKIYEPMMAQAHKYMNPLDRAKQQSLSGTKSVAWDLPQDKFRLRANWREDPARRPLTEYMCENAFHEAAEAVLRPSHSAPALGGGKRPEDHPTTFIPRRPLAVAKWSGKIYPDTLYGKFAQDEDEETNFRKTTRGGPGVHLPLESDGVLPAGTKASKKYGHFNRGILVGDLALRGECAQEKRFLGRSTGAPMQDHFGFETGYEATDLEFPPGRRQMPPGALR